MPSYTTTTDVEALLPDTLPTSITAADKTKWVTDASKMVDGMVGTRFPMLSTNQKFADVTDTPAWIELCARWLGAYFGFLKLREINKSAKNPGQGATYWKMAHDALESIRDGKIDIYDSAGADLASSSVAWSSTDGYDAVFSRGAYKDNVLQGDAGTLDDFGLN